MADYVPYPDVEVLVMDLLAGLGTTGTVTPPDLVSHLPFIRVARHGGPDDGITDTARLDVDTFQATRPLAFALAEKVRQRLTTRYRVVDGHALDKVTTLTGPFEVPWDDTGQIRRFTAAYQVSVRR